MKISLAIQITLLRILLTPIIVCSAIYSKWWQAAFLFIIAVFTDFLDGFIARKYHQESRLGQLLDPIADKTLIISLMYAIFLSNHCNNINLFSYNVGLFFIGKEIIFLSGASILYIFYKKFFKPTLFSRIVSVLEMFIILNTLIASALNIKLLESKIFQNISIFMFENIYYLISETILFLTIFLSVLLLLQYVWKISIFLTRKNV